MHPAFGNNRIFERNAMSNNENLKPCPFCGGRAKLVVQFGDEFMVLCPNCEAQTNFHDKEGAIAAWNRRVCVKQNAETLDTNSVASSGVNAKLTYADIEKMVAAKWGQYDAIKRIWFEELVAAVLGVERSEQ